LSHRVVMRNSDLKKLRYQDEVKVDEQGLRVKANKNKTCSWILQKRLIGKAAPLRIVLGKWPDTSLDEAMEKAIRYRKLIADGIDPRDYEKEQREKANLKEAEAKASAITLRTLLEMYEKSRIIEEIGDAPATMRGRRSAILNVWEPFLEKSIQEIQGPALLDHYHYYTSQRVNPKTGKPAKVHAKTAIRYLKTLFNYAIQARELLEKNPCLIFKNVRTSTDTVEQGWIRPKEAPEVFEWVAKIREASSSNSDYKNLHPKLTKHVFSEDAEMQLDSLTLTLLTGLRGRSEVVSLPWANIFLEKHEYQEVDAEVPFFKTWTKQARWFGVPITPQMETIFRRRKRKRINDYVFPSPSSVRKDLPLENDTYAYKVLNLLMTAKNAKVIGQKVFRHTFATACDALYHDDLLADKITGHGAKPRRTSTAGYVHRDVSENLKYFKAINDVLSGDVEYPTEDWTEEEIGKAIRYGEGEREEEEYAEEMERASVERSLRR
jgi:integrase